MKTRTPKEMPASVLNRIPTGYEFLRPNVKRLLADWPHYRRNVILIMRFLNTEPMARVHAALCRSLAASGLNPLRADDRAYHPELWSNICTYMLGCSKAVVVFEDIEVREFNPNVALELGYMLALNKPALILKEKRLPRPPTDIIGRLWKEFDSFDVEQTVEKRVSEWLLDIHFQPPRIHLPTPVLRFLVKEATAFHQTLLALDDEFNLEFVFDDKAAQVFREIVGRLAVSGPVFKTSTLFHELARDDKRMETLLKEREQIAALYKKEVMAPLDDLAMPSRERIQRAHMGVKRTLEADYALIRRVQKAYRVPTADGRK